MSHLTCKTKGRQKKRWEDNIREWTGLEFAKSPRAVENRKIEGTGCEVIRGSSTSPAVKGYLEVNQVTLDKRRRRRRRRNKPLGGWLYDRTDTIHFLIVISNLTVIGSMTELTDLFLNYKYQIPQKCQVGFFLCQFNRLTEQIRRNCL